MKRLKPLVSVGMATVAIRTPALAAWSHDPSQNNSVNQLYGSQVFPAAVSDGAGGTFVVWQDSRNRFG